MRANRIRTALQALGGAGTTQDITGIVRARPECVSAQLSGMAQRGQVRRMGRRLVAVKRWDNGRRMVPATIWELTC